VRQRIKFRGMFIPLDEISFQEDVHGGKFVYDERLSAMLEKICRQYVERRGKVPGVLKVSSHPFTYFIPLNVQGEIMGMNIKGIPTNSYVFIAVRRMM